ncbi:MAG: 2-polyprenyl-3-methyl-5-hydroxy-6-metoxy-1,4-benzoquinol methylase [Bacteroidia bacterium]|jgi:2-polyprenyl-3-methyl-5-hydroxy-6-metoxy-1,4-benzoquinol methylase
MIYDTEGGILINTDEHPEYAYQDLGGLHSFLKPELRRRLEDFLEAFEDFREKQNNRILDPKKYPELPFVDENPESWKNRQRDIEFLEKIFSIAGKRVLEIGAWNGWLSNRLALSGATVCAIDYFKDPYDGLAAKTHYPNSNWTTIQMDCEDLTVFRPGFQFIIFNWHLMTCSEPWKVIEQAIQLLANDGVLIILGFLVVKKTDDTEAYFKQVSNQFQKEYKLPFGLRPFTGYFTPIDLNHLRNSGFQTTRYNSLKGVLKAILKPSAAQPYRAVYYSND